MNPHGSADPGSGHHDVDIDWERMAAHLEAVGDVQLAVLRRTAARLRDLLGPTRDVRRVLDIGSGPGVMACVFAEEFERAEVVAVDAAPGLLDRARARAERLGLDGRVSVRCAQLPEDVVGGDRVGADGPGTAELVWSGMALHHVGDQQAMVDGLARVVRPGGLLAVAEAGLPMRFLPRDIGIGKPGLQARLDAAGEHWFELMRAELPGSTDVIEDWPAMLGRAGLTDVGSFTTLLDVPAPLSAPARAFLSGHLDRVRETVGEFLDDVDRTTLDVLLDPEAPEGVLRRPDAFLLSVGTVFTGVRPAR
ncbi:class I SAM-dependent methyltransferase [Embleya sp. NPDC050154]|uniref:class I SAM-dependent methyltransferase n=1 Tax=unclassified Embleya TaxID=2699296 RepID=UPI0037A0889D